MLTRNCQTRGNQRWWYKNQQNYNFNQLSNSKNNEDEIMIKMLEFLFDNIFAVFAGKVFQQTVGILIVPLFSSPPISSCIHTKRISFSLFSQRERKVSISGQYHRHIDDVLSIINPEFENHLASELEIKNTTESTTSASYLYFLLRRMVNFTIPSTTNDMISYSTSQTFRSWVVIFNHLYL